MNHKEKTIPFHLFMDIAIGEKEFVEIRGRTAVTIAKFLELIDFDSQHCYIQYPEEWPGIDYPRIWRISTWRRASERWTEIKNTEQVRRKYDCSVAEAHIQLQDWLYSKYPFKKENKIDREFVTQVCYRIIHDRNEDVAAQFGVDLSDIPLEKPTERRL
jgi:hypothetical protein